MATKVAALVTKKTAAKLANDAYESAKASLTNLKEARDAAADALRDQHKAVVSAAASEAMGDPTLLTATGYALAAVASQPVAPGQIANLSVTASDMDGSLDVSFDPDANSKTYEVQISTTDPVAGPWITKAQPTTSTVTPRSGQRTARLGAGTRHRDQGTRHMERSGDEDRPVGEGGKMDELEDCLTQVHRMALAAMQSFTFWLRTNPDDSVHEATIQKFGHFFYATHEAHLTMMIVSLDALYDDKDRLINFQKLLTLVKPKLTPKQFDPLAARIEKFRKLAKGVGIVRNNSFAHIAARETRIKQGEKYALSQGECLSMCYNSLDIVTQIARLLGETLPDATDMNATDVEQIEALFAKLELNE